MSGLPPLPTKNRRIATTHLGDRYDDFLFAVRGEADIRLVSGERTRSGRQAARKTCRNGGYCVTGTTSVRSVCGSAVMLPVKSRSVAWASMLLGADVMLVMTVLLLAAINRANTVARVTMVDVVRMGWASLGPN